MKAIPGLPLCKLEVSTQALQCRDTGSAGQQSPGHHTQVNGKALSLHSPSTITNLVQVTDMNNGGVSIFRSAAQLLSTRCKLRLWCKPDAVCHECAYLHFLDCPAAGCSMLCHAVVFVLADACCIYVNGKCFV